MYRASIRALTDCSDYNGALTHQLLISLPRCFISSLNLKSVSANSKERQLNNIKAASQSTPTSVLVRYKKCQFTASSSNYALNHLLFHQTLRPNRPGAPRTPTATDND